MMTWLKRLATAGFITVAAITAWLALRSPPDAVVDLRKFCTYIRNSMTNAQCTAPVGPEAFPVGNVVSVPLPLDFLQPIQPTVRELARICWMDPDTTSRVEMDLRQPSADISLPDFEFDLKQNIDAGGSIRVAGLDSAKVKAGAKSDEIASISVKPRNPRIIQLDMGKLEGYLRRPEWNEDCLGRLLQPDTRLVIGVVIADGFDYRVGTRNGSSVDLLAAVREGFLKIRDHIDETTIADVKSAISTDQPRVIAAQFADGATIETFRALVPKGDVVRARNGAIRAKAAVQGTVIPNMQYADQWFPASDGTIALPAGFRIGLRESVIGVTSRLQPSRVEIWNYPSVAGTIRISHGESYPPKLAGSSTTVFSVDIRLLSGPMSVARFSEARWLGFYPYEQVEMIAERPHMTFEALIGSSFEVLKRSSGPAHVVVHLANGLAPGRSKLDQIIVSIEDAVGRTLSDPKRITTDQIPDKGMDVTALVHNAALYKVQIGYGIVRDLTESNMIIGSDIVVRASLVPYE